MNNTVTLSQLITRLAAKTGTDPNTTRRFLRTFFASIEAALVEGQSVTIKGIGTFRRPADALESTAPVVFVPDATLAEEINAPFAMFEPVELADGVDFEPEAKPEPAPMPEPEPAPAPAPEPAPEPAPAHAPKPEPAPAPTPTPAPAPAPAPVPEVEEPYVVPLGAADDEEEAEIPAPKQEVVEKKPAQPRHTPREEYRYVGRTPHYKYDTPTKPSRKLWIIAAIAIVVVCIGAYIAAILATADEFPIYEEDYTRPAIEQPADSAPVFEEVSVDEVSAQAVAPVATSATETATQAATEQPKPEAKPETKPEAKPASTAERRTDTVTSTRYLATMARQYYGKSIYWVFIYQANADHLRNPNRIKPGTVVVIPDKESFMEATDEATVRKAEKIKAELDQRFN